MEQRTLLDATGIISGVVFDDFDGHGTREVVEDGLYGVTVFCYDLGEDGVFGNDDRNLRTFSSADGTFSFSDLALGDYYLKFVKPHARFFSPQDQGSDESADSDVDPTTGLTDIFTLEDGQTEASRDVGLFLRGSVEGMVFSDLSRDGIQDPGENGVAEITVNLRLWEPGFSVVDTTTTADDGTYEFLDLSYGVYFVEVIAPPSTEFSPPFQGGDPTIDSDVNPANGRSTPFMLFGGQDIDDLDAGLFGIGDNVPIPGRVWEDADGDGVQDPEEPGWAGVTVELLSAELGVVFATTTDANGEFLFFGSGEEWNSLRFTAPQGATFSPMNRGDDDLLDSDVNRVTGRTAPFYSIRGQVQSSFAAGVHRNTGAALVADINAAVSSSQLDNLTNVDGTLFFVAYDTVHGRELWKSDGTPTGTVLVKDIYPGVNSSEIWSGVNVNGTLFFSAQDGEHGWELWKSDGTEAGTVMVKDIRPDNGSSNPMYLADVGGTLFFSGDDGVYGRELWMSDGTEAGTVMVKNIEPGISSSSLKSLTAVDGTLFFSADGRVDGGVVGRELWKSDGTEAGTVMVKDIAVGSSNPVWLTDVGGTLFFTAYDDENGRELWKTDGTPSGTVIVGPGNWSDPPSLLTNVDGTLFFRAGDNEYGRELWKSDGTDPGTLMVKNIRPEDSDSAPTSLTNVDGTLFFTANDGKHGRDLWKSDGSQAGTVMVADLNAGVYEPYLEDLTAAAGKLFFTAEDQVHGRELWISDGTEAGTAMVKNIMWRDWDSYPAYLTDVDGTLFFRASHRDLGSELWKADGSVAFSTELRDSLRITEIMWDVSEYDPYYGEYFAAEFIELKNISSKPIDLDGVRFIDGVAFDFSHADLSTLFPDEHLVVIKRRADFERIYDTAEINIAGQYEGWLENDGERIELVSPINRTILEFAYDPRWFVLTERIQFALTTVDETADPQLWDGRSGWRPSSLPAGSPGMDDPRLTPDPGAVVINEILTNQTDGYSDWIELFNTTDQPVNIGGWFLGDDRNGRPEFTNDQIPWGTILPAGGYQVFRRGKDFSFGLSSRGEKLQLTAGYTDVFGWSQLLGYSESVHFGSAESEVTIGRHTVRSRFAETEDFSPPVGSQYIPAQGAVTSTLLVEGVAGPILDLNLTELRILHDQGNELRVQLSSPAGTTVELLTHVGSPDASASHYWFYQTVLDDEATLPITLGEPLFAGEFRPQGPLAGFDGEDPNGIWTLTVIDDVAGEAGYLYDWGLQLTTGIDDLDFVFLSEPTEGYENAAPKVGPVVINEIMYHPAFLQDEFIELFNLTPLPVDLSNWHLQGISYYNLPDGTVIPGFGFALVVPIDPAEFRAKYGIAAEVPIVGPYYGALGNGGDDLQLYKLNADYPGRVVLVDRARYDDELPWPEEADIGGGSLERVTPGAYGDDPANWNVTAIFGGTPGSANTTPQALIAGRHVFYNNSSWDDTSKGQGDDDAIAPNKTALLPGQTADFANYTSYVRGISGIVVDIAALSGTITADDFEFAVGNDNDPANWLPAAVPTVDVQPGSVTRVTMTWPDNVIQNEWLQVTVKADPDTTGLAEDDVFYFGNLIGECTGDGEVDAFDILETRNNPRPFFNPALIDTVHDFNRDQRVDAIDTLIARENQTWAMTELQLIDLSGSKHVGWDAVPPFDAEKEIPSFDAEEVGLRCATSQPTSVRDASLAWLFDLEQSDTQRQRWNHSRLAEAVDRLLARGWL